MSRSSAVLRHHDMVPQNEGRKSSPVKTYKMGEDGKLKLVKIEEVKWTHKRDSARLRQDFSRECGNSPYGQYLITSTTYYDEEGTPTTTPAG